jgi:hypothetical protein
MGKSNFTFFKRKHSRKIPKVKKGKSFRRKIQNGIVNENELITYKINDIIQTPNTTNLRVSHISKMLNVDHKSIIQCLKDDNLYINMHSIITKEDLIKLKSAFENNKIELIKYEIKAISVGKVKRPYAILINTPMK